MARRGSRKVTPMLVADSFAVLRSVSEAITVLQRWHPGSLPIAILAQQLLALDREFRALEVAVPAPTAGMFEEQG